jgi:hypothetical protein
VLAGDQENRRISVVVEFEKTTNLLFLLTS